MEVALVVLCVHAAQHQLAILLVAQVEAEDGLREVLRAHEYLQGRHAAEGVEAQAQDAVEDLEAYRNNMEKLRKSKENMKKARKNKENHGKTVKMG